MNITKRIIELAAYWLGERRLVRTFRDTRQGVSLFCDLKSCAYVALSAAAFLISQLLGFGSSPAWATPSISVPYQALSFDTVNQRATPPANVADRQLIITNNGVEEAWVYAFSFQPSAYSLISHNCPYNLQPGASCAATIRFNPINQSNGSVNGTATITVYGAPYYFTAQLSAVSYTPLGTLTLISSSNAYFGMQPYGTPITQTLTLQNTGSTTITATPPSSSDTNYIVSGTTCIGSIAPGATCNMQVSFVPSAVGTVVSTITMPNSGVTGTVTVTGSGAGAPGVVFGGGGTTGTGGVNVDDKNTGLPGVAVSSACDDDPNNCVVVSCTPTNRTNCGDDEDEEPVGRSGSYIGNRGGGAAGAGAGKGKTSTPTPPPKKDPCAPDAGGGSGNSPKPYFNPADDIGANGHADNRGWVGDPIHAGLGNKSHPQTDYKARGGYSLAFIRTYQAQAGNSSKYVRQKMGPGWYGNWDRSVNVVGTTARVLRGDGSSVLFIQQSNGVWAPPTTDIVDKLQATFSGPYQSGWKYITGDIVENYSYAGQLMTVALTTGELYTLTYGNSGLKTVVDPANRVLTFNYNAKGRLSALVDPSGATTTYAYDDDGNVPPTLTSLGRLLSVTFPDARARRYKYDLVTNKFALTSIATFENGVENTYVSFSYEPSSGRALGNSFGSNPVEAQRSGRVAVFYNTDGSSVSYDPSRVARTSQGDYDLITPGQFPTSATVTRSFTTIQGLVLPTLITYRHICAGCPDLSESFNYNSDGRLASRVDRKGVTTSFSYTNDGRGLVASTTQAAGTAIAKTVSSTWHATLSLPLQVVEPTRTTNYTYDSAGRTLTVSVIAAGQPTRTTTNTYNAQGWLASVKGPRTDVNDTTTFTYYTGGANLGSSYQITNSKGQVTTFNSYDSHGNATNVTNADGTTSIFSYDPRGRLLTENQAGQTIVRTYATNGLLKTSINPYGLVTTYIYDDAQRLIGKNESNGEYVAYTLDNMGRTLQTQTFDAQGNLVSSASTVYDGLGRILQSINAANKVTNYTYDANGNVTTVVDPNNLTTATQYDSLNRPILVIDPLLKTVATTYNADGDIATVQDPNNNVTTYTYNGFGDTTVIQSPDTATTSMNYNEGGLIVSKTDARNKTTYYYYDVLSRVTGMSTTDGNTTRSYDVAQNGVGRLASVMDPSGGTTYTYDSYGRVATTNAYISGLGMVRTISYSRDTQGRVTSITYPGGNVMGLAYAQGRVTSITLNNLPLISAVQYFPLGGAESWLLGPDNAGSAAFIREYDLSGRPTRYSTATGHRTLGYDNGSRIIQVSNYLGNAVTPSAIQSFGYDNAGRLSSFNGYTSNGNGQANINQTQSFTYDNNGNRLSSVLNGVASTYSYQSASNRLAGVSGALTKVNTYDAVGNLTADGSAVHTYDARGRMVTTNAGGVATSYLVNYQNLRVKKSNINETLYFVYDQAGHMLGEYDQGGNTVQELFWLGDTPVAVRGTMPCLTGGNCSEAGVGYIWTDHLNTPREITRVTGFGQHVSMWKWDSLPFGEAHPNANPSNLGVMLFNHRFPGQYKDSETGLFQNWNREYDPMLGRYVTSDPKGLNAGTNTYLYSNGDPALNRDPTGLETYQCTRKLNNFPIRMGPLYHQFICIGNGASGYSCGGLGPTGNMFNSPGQIESDTYSAEACTKVADDNQCVEKCIGEAFKSGVPNYSVDLKNGANCQTWAGATFSECSAKCKYVKK